MSKVTCDGNEEIRDCPNEAIWTAKGLSAQFGAPLTTHHCQACKDRLPKEGESNDPINEYNRFEVHWTKLYPERPELYPK